ncbi:hypothetical protein [Microcella alkalica]|uniref:Uncharacterized protein n=1 Tax=Microcella alkalica TaxID=355930 RepID=A0A839EBI2_9MICO|nr:hypothetical protein [Microcella alkalica]MBA8847604.1 hypothetical protein [Microcella alkalica]
MTSRPPALRRVSLVRLALVAALTGLIIVAASPSAGPLRGVARGLLIVVALMILVSYLVEYLLARQRR